MVGERRGSRLSGHLGMVGGCGLCRDSGLSRHLGMVGERRGSRFSGDIRLVRDFWDCGL